MYLDRHILQLNKNTMKRTLLTALVVCASLFAATAQDQKATASSPVAVEKETDQKAIQAKKAQEWNDMLKTELKLTEEHVTKIAELNNAFGERRKAIHNNAELTDEVKNEKKMALKKAWDTQFLNILTPEQQVKYKELLQSKK